MGAAHYAADAVTAENRISRLELMRQLPASIIHLNLTPARPAASVSSVEPCHIQRESHGPSTTIYRRGHIGATRGRCRQIVKEVIALILDAAEEIRGKVLESSILEIHTLLESQGSAIADEMIQTPAAVPLSRLQSLRQLALVVIGMLDILLESREEPIRRLVITQPVNQIFHSSEAVWAQLAAVSGSQESGKDLCYGRGVIRLLLRSIPHSYRALPRTHPPHL
jgi:hypothetical protein